MSEKQNDFLTISIIAVIVLAFAVLDFLYQMGLIYQDPSVTLDPQPAFSARSFLTGTYLEDYGNYADSHFYNKNKWAGLVRETELLLGKKEFQGVLLGKQKTYFEKHLAQDVSAAQVTESLEFLETLTTQYGAKVMLLPTADEIWRDRLPLYLDSMNQKAYLDQVRETVGDEAYIDTYSVLWAHRAEEIYYRTDPHWTSLGAYYGYQTWWKQSGKLLPYYYDLSHMSVIASYFKGTLVRTADMEDAGEELTVFEETQGKFVDVSYDGRVSVQGYYRPEYLDSDNPYGYVLGDGFGYAKIDTGLERKDSLVVIGDSYANAMIPLLAPHYQTIYFVNPGNYHGDLWSLLTQQNKSEVLVLGSVPALLNWFGQKE